MTSKRARRRRRGRERYGMRLTRREQRAMRERHREVGAELHAALMALPPQELNRRLRMLLVEIFMEEP